MTTIQRKERGERGEKEREREAESGTVLRPVIYTKLRIRSQTYLLLYIIPSR